VAIRIEWSMLACRTGFFAVALIFLAGVSGCGLYTTFEKCGLAGCPGDQEISAQVRTLLNQHPALEAPNLITVQTVDHIVYLSGVLDTDLERQMAESVAAQAAGVRRVVNSIGLNNSR
jgi:osmotically-inducible protein OsmY